MKKVIGLLCMILFLTGCGQAQKASEMPTPQSDAAQAEGQAHVPEDYLQSNIGFADLVETPEGYYYAAKVRPMRYGADVPPMLFQLCFCPKGESTFCVLCGKPNCLHLDQDCNACADRVFTYFNGAIYTVSHDSGLRLDKMNLDGTDHQSVAVVVDLTTSCTLDYHFHHGKLFVASLPDQTAPLELQESHLFALDLTDYSRKELATDYFQTGEIFCIAKLYRDKLYFYGCQKDSSYDMNAVQLVEVDVNTGASRVLMQGNMGCDYVTDSTIYYVERGSRLLSASSGMPTEAENERSRFAEYDRSTGAVRYVDAPLEEEIFSVLYDEDFIYVIGWVDNGNYPYDDTYSAQHTLYFLNRDYQLVDQITLEPGVFCNVVASDRIFFSDNNAPLTDYLDKSEIGSHKLTLHPLEAVGFPQVETP